MRTSIRVHTTFEGLHQYPIAPEGVEDLRSLHRHIFHIRFQVEVFHDNREIEFFLFKHDVEKAIKESFEFSDEYGAYLLGACSCEMIAKKLNDKLGQKYDLLSRNVVISISEDESNEAIVEVPAS